MEEWDSDEAIDNDDDEIDDAIIMDDDGDGNNHQASSSSSSTFLQQLVAQRTAFVQVKQEQGQQTTMDHASDGIIITNNNNHDPEGHLCVVCMDNEHSCLYVPCNHLAVCAECDADIMAACLPCPMCKAAIDRDGSVVAGGVVVA